MIAVMHNLHTHKEEGTQFHVSFFISCPPLLDQTPLGKVDIFGKVYSPPGYTPNFGPINFINMSYRIQKTM
jgi:hypothetical protein